MNESPEHILSFDVEEYFHVEAAHGRVDIEDREQWPSRLDASLERVLTLLAVVGVKATFFVLGRVAEQHPKTIRHIADAGHEIASHGMSHEMLTRLSPESFAAELTDSKALLEDISGRPVCGFRAPTFSVLPQTAWALDAMEAAGYTYDSSIFPVRHDRYGIPDAPRWIHRALGPSGGGVVEIPPTTLNLWRWNLPAGGGGYLRLFPSAMLRWALLQARQAKQPGMIYLHPWEFDPDQPQLPLGRLGSWRHSVNIDKTASKLLKLIDQFSFGPACEVLKTRDLTTLPVKQYGQPEA